MQAYADLVLRGGNVVTLARGPAAAGAVAAITAHLPGARRSL